jgi:C-terminal processing protease CtpA/Prc
MPVPVVTPQKQPAPSRPRTPASPSPSAGADRPRQQEEEDAVRFLSLLGEQSRHTSVPPQARPKTAAAAPEKTPAPAPASAASSMKRPKTAPKPAAVLSADEEDKYGSFMSLLENYPGEFAGAPPPKPQPEPQPEAARVGIPAVPVEQAAAPSSLVELRPKSSGRAKTPVLLSPRSQAFLDRPPKSPSPRAFEILDLPEPINVPFPLSDLYLLPAQDMEVMVPKTSGQLRLQIRHDDEGDIHGLFVHGFRANCRAEELGLIKVGDELLKVNGEVVKGGYLEDVIAALRTHDEDEVQMLIRRHALPSIDQSPADYNFDIADIHHNEGEVGDGLSDLSPRPFAVSNQPFSAEDDFPSLYDLFTLPAEDIEVMVPKTSGQLRIQLRHDDEGDIHGLFVHGFRAFSRAEEQGLIRVADEIIKVDGVVVKGGYLEDVIDILRGHAGDHVSMVVRRFSAEMRPGSRGSYLEHHMKEDFSPRAFQVTNFVGTQGTFPPLEVLFDLPSTDIKVRVPKTQGQLRIQLRHDDEGELHGLFVHGFRPFSRVEEQGLLHVGDEFIKVNGLSVKGGYLENVVDALQDHEEEFVDIVVRRHFQKKG